VVQGSVLGPILFLIFINDIDIAIKATDENVYVSKFADDTKVGREIEDASDAYKLQMAINNLVKWCEDWGMSLHPDKCVVIHFGLKNPQYEYFIAGNKMKTENVTRDLGVYISNTCDSSAHVDKIAKKAHGVLSQIRRSTILRDHRTILTLYKSFIRPLIESAAPAWNPFKRGDVEKLEKVQRRSLRLIGDLEKMPYEKRLEKLNLQKLEDRRERGDQIECFKYMNGFNDVNPDRLFTFVRDRHNKPTRSYADNNIVSEKTSLNIRKYFFTNRVTNTWNSLPSDIREATSVNSFKNKYDEFTKLMSS